MEHFAHTDKLHDYTLNIARNFEAFKFETTIYVIFAVSLTCDTSCQYFAEIFCKDTASPLVTINDVISFYGNTIVTDGVFVSFL